MFKNINVDHIKKLWILDLIVKSGSFKLAAIHAKVSPSAISQTLTSLEKSSGKILVFRHRGNISATPEALALLDMIRPTFAVLEQMHNLESSPLPRISWLNFGTYESIAVNILPSLVSRLRDRMPHLRLRLRISRTNDLLQMIRKGELSSALITEVDNVGRLQSKEIARDKLGFFIAKKHPIAEQGWDAIHKYGLGSLSPGKEGLPLYFTKFLKQIKSTPSFIQTDSFEILRAAAASGVLVAILPHRVANRANDLVEIFPNDKQENTHSGEHRLLLVNQASADPDEIDFLIQQLRLLLRN